MKTTLDHLQDYLISIWKPALLVIFAIILCGSCNREAHADSMVNVDALANAIYRAENSRTHPYGVMVKYKHTTPRQACINSINHRLRDWDGKGEFIAYLGSFYAPIGVSNDPSGLNRNWVKNVKYFYEKENK